MLSSKLSKHGYLRGAKTHPMHSLPLAGILMIAELFIVNKCDRRSISRVTYSFYRANPKNVLLMKIT